MLEEKREKSELRDEDVDEMEVERAMGPVHMESRRESSLFIRSDTLARGSVL